MKTLTVNEVLNRVATGVGIDEDVADPYSNPGKHFIQLKSLLQDAGDELVQLYDWEVLQTETNFTTTLLGNPYSLPSDYDRMMPGTHWDRAQNYPVGGSINAQDWQYLKGRDLVDNTIYASFRQKENELHIFPDQADFEIYYEYISKNWIQDGTDVNEFRDEISAGDDIIRFDGAMIRHYLRAKYYEAKGMDGPTPQRVASMFYNNRRGKDTASPILNVGDIRTNYPYLDGVRSTPDTGYGA